MKYQDKSFAVSMGGEKYGENWERTFRAEAEALDPKPTPGDMPSNLKQFVHHFACRECATTTRIITSAVIAAKGSFYIRADVGAPANPLGCPVCRNPFTSEEKQP